MQTRINLLAKERKKERANADTDSDSEEEKSGNDNNNNKNMEEREEIIVQAALHVKMAKQQRMLFNLKKQQSKDDHHKSWDKNSNKVWTFVADYAQNMYETEPVCSLERWPSVASAPMSRST